MISDRAKQIGASPTLRIAAKAKAMIAEGIDIVDLSVGEPDFSTPDNIKAAAIRAVENNITRYTANPGLEELRMAIISRIQSDQGITYHPSELIVSCGAKHSVYNAVMALLNEGEEVIIPEPYWVSYPEMVRLAGGKPVFVRAKEENGFKLTGDQLKAAISANTKALILNNPSNPTGAAYSRAELEELGRIIVDENIMVIADEIYEKLVYDDFRFVSFASVSEEVRNRTILINGVSKAYAMTGWRIGYAAGPADIVSAMSKIQSHSTSNAASISQMAALEAFNGPQYEISKMVSEFQKRRNYVTYRLGTIRGVSCHNPEGAFYVFPNMASFYDMEHDGMMIRNSYGMAYYLLKHARVAIIPGGAFGTDECIRISYASSMDNLEKGMDRIIQALRELKTPRKIKKLALKNTATRIDKPVPVEAKLDQDRRDALVGEAQAHLTHDSYYEWNANINGVLVQLRTNMAHLYDFWIENWYPAQLETDIEPHGIIYAVDGITGREPYAFYSSETKTGIIFNSDYYGTLRQLALGLVADAAERLYDIQIIRGMSLDIGGWGVLLLGPEGTRKTEIFFDLLKYGETMMHSHDAMFVRYGGGYALADSPERKFYIPTRTADLHHDLPGLFDLSRCENVLTHKELCKNEACLLEDNCRLDRGSPYCYRALKRSHAMLDPYWLGGMNKHVKRIDLKHVFILKNDPLAPPLETPDIDDVIRVLELGQVPGAGQGFSETRPKPFYNPYLLIADSERNDIQKRFFRKLFKLSKFHFLNSGRLDMDDIRNTLLKIVNEGDQSHG